MRRSNRFILTTNCWCRASPYGGVDQTWTLSIYSQVRWSRQQQSGRSACQLRAKSPNLAVQLASSPGFLPEFQFLLAQLSCPLEVLGLDCFVRSCQHLTQFLIQLLRGRRAVTMQQTGCENPPHQSSRSPYPAGSDRSNVVGLRAWQRLLGLHRKSLACGAAHSDLQTMEDLTVSATVGSPTIIGWKRRSKAASLLNVLAVLIESCGPNAPKLTPLRQVSAGLLHPCRHRAIRLPPGYALRQ